MQYTQGFQNRLDGFTSISFHQVILNIHGTRQLKALQVAMASNQEYSNQAEYQNPHTLYNMPDNCFHHLKVIKFCTILIFYV
jgi:hypothetical protein